MSARPAPQTHSDLDEVQQQVQMASMDNEPIAAQQLNSDAPPLSRNIVVSIRASLDDLCNESSASKWAPSEGALRSMFRQRRFTSLSVYIWYLNPQFPILSIQTAVASLVSPCYTGTAPPSPRVTSRASCSTT